MQIEASGVSLVPSGGERRTIAKPVIVAAPRGHEYRGRVLARMTFRPIEVMLAPELVR
jgi:hypothetical protein